MTYKKKRRKDKQKETNEKEEHSRSMEKYTGKEEGDEVTSFKRVTAGNSLKLFILFTVTA